tara:strand:+ start:1633 stop:1977 length:345 start_codon:yes stop_codon:yes gene_type:complete
MDWMREGLSLPIIKPPSPNQLQKVYFWFGEPIETAHLNGSQAEEEVWQVREKTRVAIEGGIQELISKQEADPHRQLRARLAHDIKKVQTNLQHQVWDRIASIYQTNGKGSEKSD